MVKYGCKVERPVVPKILEVSADEGRLRDGGDYAVMVSFLSCFLLGEGLILRRRGRGTGGVLCVRVEMGSGMEVVEVAFFLWC